MEELAALVPKGVVTRIFTFPADTEGETAVICVLLSTVKLAASVLPNCTEVAPVKLRPVSTTLVPPRVGPVETERLFTAGVSSTTERVVDPTIESKLALIVMGEVVSELPALARPALLRVTKLSFEEDQVTKWVISAVEESE